MGKTVRTWEEMTYINGVLKKNNIQLLESIEPLAKKYSKLEEVNQQMVPAIKRLENWYSNGTRTGDTLNDVIIPLFKLANKLEEILGVQW